jgi:hypothetical protein
LTKLSAIVRHISSTCVHGFDELRHAVVFPPYQTALHAACRRQGKGDHVVARVTVRPK